VTVGHINAVCAAECFKIIRQLKTRATLAACVAGPLAFAAVIRLQSSLPEDTLFGRSVKDTGFALPLVILGFAALWAFPVLSSMVRGDLFAAEDRYGMWTGLLTRSVSRGEVFVGKTLAALAFSMVAIAVLAASSIGAGLLLIGTQPIVNLSGVLLMPDVALRQVAAAWLSVVPSVSAFTTIALLASVVTRSSIAGIGLPVGIGLGMQLYGLVDGPEAARGLLLTSGFGAWHGLFASPPYYEPLASAAVVSGGCCVACIAIAYRVLRHRDIGR
jgi:ABC-2 type transport system permease protein